MDIILTKDIQNHWIFQDAEKFRWWVDLHFMADENGEIRMSLTDLAHRWKAERTKVSRFLAKLNGATVGATLLQHQVQQITLTRIGSYKDACNSECNTFATPDATPQRKPPCSPSSFSPTPPISSPPIIPQEIPNPYALTREAEYADKYREEGDNGMWVNVAMMLHLKSVEEAVALFGRFVMETQHNGDEHQTYGDFKRHFLQWARIAITKEKSNGNNRPDNSKRGRADVPKDITLDF